MIVLGENRTVTGSNYVGVMAHRRARLVGLRRYLTTITTPVVDDGLLAPAFDHDSPVLPALREDVTDRVVLEDRNVFVYVPPRWDTRKRPPGPIWYIGGWGHPPPDGNGMEYLNAGV